MHTAGFLPRPSNGAATPRYLAPLVGGRPAGFVVLFVGLVVGPVMLGCKPGVNRPATAPVSGTVTLGGAPVAGATVSFQAVDGGRSSVAITDASGRYELTTFVRGDGAVPGDYKVAVSKMTQDVVESAPGERYEPPSGPIPEPKNQLPAKYANADKSGLKVTVTTGSNAASFDLTR